MTKNRTMTVSDTEADRSIESLETGPIVPMSAPLCGVVLSGKRAADATAPMSPDISLAEMRLLQAIITHPMRPSTEYAKLAGMSPNTLRKARIALVDRGLIGESKLETAGRGRAAIVLEPLERAQQLVADPEE